MRTRILIAALILALSTAAHATERGLAIPQATPVDAPVILSAEQLAAQPVQQAPVQGVAAGAQQPSAAAAQQPADLAQPINGTHQTQSAAQQQQAAQRQQMQQQKMQRMQQQRMQQEQMARNMPLEQKVAYKVHQVKTKIKMKLVQAIMR